MKNSLTIFLFFAAVLIFISCKEQSNDRGWEPAKVSVDSCSTLRDTTIILQFTKDSSQSDFLQLLSFIESKGSFSRYDRKKHSVDSSAQSVIALEKMLCPVLFEKSPFERYVLKNLFSTRILLNSSKPLAGTKDYFPAFTLTQINFVNEKERAIGYEKNIPRRLGKSIVKMERLLCY